MLYQAELRSDVPVYQGLIVSYRVSVLCGNSADPPSEPRNRPEHGHLPIPSQEFTIAATPYARMDEERTVEAFLKDCSLGSTARQTRNPFSSISWAVR